MTARAALRRVRLAALAAALCACAADEPDHEARPFDLADLEEWELRTAGTADLALRRTAVETFRRGRGRLALQQTYTTVEGDPITVYLLVDGSRVRTVHDGRADRFGSGGVTQTALDSLTLGYYPYEARPEVVRVPLDGAAHASRPLLLLCWIDGRVVCHF